MGITSAPLREEEPKSVRVGATGEDAAGFDLPRTLCEARFRGAVVPIAEEPSRDLVCRVSTLRVSNLSAG
jgi:hypothetical protein